MELIQHHGYPVERHTIQTEDGYILETHRIPHGKNNAGEPNKPVVFVQHGVLSSSADWVNMGPEKGLGFLLADAGYDVWMGNSRGNTWSRKHVSLDPDFDLAYFWNFSWNEMGIYDIPANIDYILAQTGAPNLFYIGHSQGTTVFYVMASEKPEYNDKIRLASLLGPAAYMEHLENPLLQLMALYETNIQWMTYWIGMYEFQPHSDIGSLMGQWYCQDMAISQAMCANSIFMIAGYDSVQLNSVCFNLFLLIFEAINLNYFRPCFR